MRPTDSRLLLDRIHKGAQAIFTYGGNHHYSPFIYSRRYLMHKLIVFGFAALCLIGTGSLAIADEAMMGEMGNMKNEMKTEKDAMKGEMKAKKAAMKGKTKVHKEAVKAKRHESKSKMKTNKGAAKGKPAAAAPMSSPAPAPAQ
jgi:Sec-independent protein translocase protein TatA